MKTELRTRAKKRVSELFKTDPKWITCTHHDLVCLALEYDLGVNQVVEIYYNHFQPKPNQEK